MTQQDEGTSPAQPKPMEPGEALREQLTKPLTSGAALALVVVSLLIVWWMTWTQSDTITSNLMNIESQISSLELRSPNTATSPETCWLIGVAARVNGKGAETLSLLSAEPTMSDCLTYAQRGALGQTQDGTAIKP